MSGRAVQGLCRCRLQQGVAARPFDEARLVQLAVKIAPKELWVASINALTVIIPTFNEAGNVAMLVEQLGDELKGVNADILFVDDSTDNTPDVIRTVAETAPLPVRVLHRGLATGQLGGAVVDGIKATDSDWVIVMDGDLQHPPATVPLLYHEAVTGSSDIVIATRYTADGDADGLGSAFRRFASCWSGRSAKALFPRRLAGCSDPMSGFFALRRSSVQLDDVVQVGYKILLAILVHRDLMVTEVPFRLGARHAGHSKASLREGLRFLRLLVQLRSGPGVLFAAVGASGVLPNLAAVAVLTSLGESYVVAALVGIQLAIVWNFIGAETIVFHDRRVGTLRRRFLRYAIASETDLLRLPFAAPLVSRGVGVLAATVITLLAALVLRFIVATRFIYRMPTVAVNTAEPVTIAAVDLCEAVVPIIAFPPVNEVA
jgi:dolichol-phosphate mannosyltransferase